MRVTLSDNVLLEHVGSDVMAMVPGADQVVALSGESARIVTSLAETGSADLEDSDILDELIRAGVVHPELAAGPSRRGVLVGAAGVAGAGVLALSMPTAAMASSDPAKFGGFANYSAPTGPFQTDEEVTFQIGEIASGLVEEGDQWKFVRAGDNKPELFFPNPLPVKVEPFEDDTFIMEFKALIKEPPGDGFVVFTADIVVSGTLFRTRGGVTTGFVVTFENDRG